MGLDKKCSIIFFEILLYLALFSFAFPFMKQSAFIKQIHRRLAQAAIGASALRNQGAAGILETARQYLQHSISLNDFFKKLSDQNKFNKFLDDHTTRMLKEFPKEAKSWGAARKALNLFFRDVVYNKSITDNYGFSNDFNKFNEAIKFLEVPLDFDVATGIYNASNETIPKWTSIKKLSKPTSDIYQDAALQIAQKKQIARVHLDLIYWRKV